MHRHDVVDLSEAMDAERFGGKASYLSLALKAGLPVPPGLVLAATSIEAIDDAELHRIVAQAASRWGAKRLAIRSSASVENRPQTAAAGLFATFLDVAPGDAAVRIRDVRGSAATEQVQSYVVHHHLDAPPRVAVLIQPMLTRNQFGFAQSGTPPLIEAYDGWSAHPTAYNLDPELLHRCERVVGGPVEIEWIEDESQLWLVQLRPALLEARTEFPVVFSSEEDSAALWRLDMEHNPTPISPAHQGIVSQLEDLRVFSGYLYYRSTAETSETSETRHTPLEDLTSQFDHELLPWCDHEIPRVEADPGTPDAALSFFLQFATRYWAVQRALATSRQVLLAYGRRHLPDAPERLLQATGGVPTAALERDQALWNLAQQARSVPGLLEYLRHPTKPAPPSPELADWFTELRAHLDRFGAFAQGWDIALPTYAEDPRPLFPILIADTAADVIAPAQRRAQAAAHATHQLRGWLESLNPSQRAELEAMSALGAAVTRVSEGDDLLFARALRVVRRAFLQVGKRLCASGRLHRADDVFFLPLALVSDEGRAAAEPLGDQVRAACAEMERQRALVPPTWIQGETRHFQLPSGELLRGAGIGGRARGRAKVVKQLSDIEGETLQGRILVVPVVLPQMTFLLSLAAGLVADYGGRLDHGAVHAREVGLAAVVGTRHATRLLRDGDELIIDGPGGRVYRL